MNEGKQKDWTSFEATTENWQTVTKRGQIESKKLCRNGTAWKKIELH